MALLYRTQRLGRHQGSDRFQHPRLFYVEPITDLFVDGLYQGSAVYGQGNWGYWAEEETPMTFVVSLQDKDHPKVWYKVGQWDVNVVLDQNNMNAPEFVEHAE